MKKNQFFKNLKYRAEYIIYLAFEKLMLFIGFSNANKFCSLIARNIGPFLKVHMIAKKNMQLALKENYNDQLLVDLWDHYGKYIAEFVYQNHLPKAFYDKNIEIQGLENIESLNKQNQPFFMSLAHIGNWDMAIKKASLLSKKIAIVYRKANNPYINELILSKRNIDNILLIPKGHEGARLLVKAIKEKYSIMMLIDQKMNEGIEVPFFGRPAMSANAIAKFALRYNYPIIPLRTSRSNDGKCIIKLYPQVDYQKSNDETKDEYNIMLKLNQIIESWIKELPAQWFWFHNRWGK